MPRTKRRKLVNHVALVLDRSGSMSPLQREAVQAFNGMLDTVRLQARTRRQETDVTLVTFADLPEVRYQGVSAASAPPLSLREYSPWGNTALWDAVWEATDRLGRLPDAGDRDASFLVIVVTDGHENQSCRSGGQVCERLRECERSDRWTFAFALPPGSKDWFVRSHGLKPGNVTEWEATAAGLRATEEKTSAGLGTYYAARARGSGSVNAFYVETDLSKVTTRQVRSKLDDLSDRFKGWTVPVEDAVKPFVERKTRRPYVVGSTYYLLQKPEKVQAYKDVLIQEKGKQAVWGGQGARDLIGLPAGADAKVTPGNHAGYDIYVQSTSVNRKLPRGTKVLVDVKRAVHLPTTW